jgi:transcriptional regulator with XRE-family HTH domain
MPTVQQFLAYLRDRRSQGHTQQQIADDFGVSRQAVEQWLSGDTSPSSAVLKLAELLRAA